VMRLLSQIGIFKESPGPKFWLTEMSQLLRSDMLGQPALRNSVLHYNDPGSWVGWQKLPDLVAQGGTTELANSSCPFALGNKLEYWHYLDTHQETLEPFNGHMTASGSPQMDFVLGWAGWAKLCTGTRVCDVGGNIGTFAGLLKVRHQHLDVTCFDLPQNIAKASQVEGVALAAGSFFEPESIPKSDVIFMKRILHDWNDADCEKILHGIAAALPKGGRLLLVEAVLPEPGEAPNAAETGAFFLDLLMLMQFGAKERTASDWQRLLESQGFALAEIIKGTHWSARLLEAVKL